MATVRSHIPLAQNRLSVSAHHPLCAVSVHNDVSDVCVDKHRMAWSAAQSDVVSHAEASYIKKKGLPSSRIKKCALIRKVAHKVTCRQRCHAE